MNHIRLSMNSCEFHYQIKVEYIVFTILRDFLTRDETSMLTDNTECQTNRVNMSNEKKDGVVDS